jgi:hypothetical protein
MVLKSIPLASKIIIFSFLQPKKMSDISAAHLSVRETDLSFGC